MIQKTFLLSAFVLLTLLISGCVQETADRISIQEAKSIAEASVCITEGNLTDSYVYNENTNTWWIDLDAQKEGCSPACVVSEETNAAEINWRCTGLMPPNEDFCGTSTEGVCDSDSDCVTDGCSGQVCRSKSEESVITNCVALECHDNEKYGLECGCFSGKCKWDNR